MTELRELIGGIAKSLIDAPDDVEVREIVGEHITVFELCVEAGDIGKVIGYEPRSCEAC